MIKHKAALLQQLAEQMRSHERYRLETLEVVIKHDKGDEGYTFELAAFVDHLANDLFWDERGNWSDCALLELRTI